jgi:hypothetical protein
MDHHAFMFHTSRQRAFSVSSRFANQGIVAIATARHGHRRLGPFDLAIL